MQKVIKSGEKDDLAALDLVENLIQHCSSGKNAKTYKATNYMTGFRKSLHLLTDKPMLYVGNIGEIDLIDIKKSKHAKNLLDYVEKNNSNVIFLYSQI